MVKDKKELAVMNAEDLIHWIKDEKIEHKSKKVDFASKIINEIGELIEGLEEGVLSLEDMDFSKNLGKEEDKFLAKEDLAQYHKYLKKLVADLGKLSNKNFEYILKKVPILFESFEDKSQSNYKKAVSFAGTELKEVGKTLGDRKSVV